MPTQRPTLVPAPRSVEWGGGQVLLPDRLTLVLKANQQELLPAAERFQRFVLERLGLALSITASDVGVGDHILIDTNAPRALHAEGYELLVGHGRIRIDAATPRGAAMGLATLKQLLASTGRRVPECQIKDWPDFTRRGVMLDISRGKVPTMASLLRFVDLLADLKINEFQLYIEHTFAYRNHKEVWQHYSPMTGEQILQLDRYCRERFIDLVPNQNSFGHMKEWLVHPRYHHLAETMDGWTGWGVRFAGPFSLCPTDPKVVPFLAELYDELLPHFTSPFFNVGCDETLDVGQGRSAAAVEEQGEHQVYVDFLLKIHRLVKQRGRTMMFWGDIIIKAPEYIERLPKDLIALEWGYEADHPFDQHCRHYRQAGLDFYVCPGTSTWNSIFGRTDNALANLRTAAEAGRKHGAKGYLNTIWGDRGHQDYEPASYLPVAYGAAVCWAVDENQELDVRPFLDRYIFQDRAEKIGGLLYDLGNVYQFTGKVPENGSLLVYLLHLAFDRPQLVEGISHEDMDRTLAILKDLGRRIDELDLAGEDGLLVLRELRNGLRMLLHACELGKLRIDEAAGEPLPPARVQSMALDLDVIIAEHRELWLKRNRVGGLEEMSLEPLRRLRLEYGRRLAAPAANP
ncbi:MAG: family 20 glycosylhydrolase [Bacillota bacterium]